VSAWAFFAGLGVYRNRHSSGRRPYNPHRIGGDIDGGIRDLWQLFARPTLQLVPYATGGPGPLHPLIVKAPGRGHGMCTSFATRAALRLSLL